MYLYSSRIVLHTVNSLHKVCNYRIKGIHYRAELQYDKLLLIIASEFVMSTASGCLHKMNILFRS